MCCVDRGNSQDRLAPRVRRRAGHNLSARPARARLHPACTVLVSLGRVRTAHRRPRRRVDGHLRVGLVQLGVDLQCKSHNARSPADRYLGLTLLLI